MVTEPNCAITLLMQALEQLLQELETKLMDPAVRRSEKAAYLIADDFRNCAPVIIHRRLHWREENSRNSGWYH